MKNNKLYTQEIIAMLLMPSISIIAIITCTLTLYIVTINDQKFLQHILSIGLSSMITIFFLDQISLVRASLQHTEHTKRKNSDIRKLIDEVTESLNKLNTSSATESGKRYHLASNSFKLMGNLTKQISDIKPKLSNKQLVESYDAYNQRLNETAHHIKEYLHLRDGKSSPASLEQEIKNIKKNSDRLLTETKNTISTLIVVGVY